jgi:hypothetical protein
MSDRLEEMRIHKCWYRPPAGCPHCEKELMKEVSQLWTVKQPDGKIRRLGSKHIEDLQKANELYCKECERYEPRPTQK